MKQAIYLHTNAYDLILVPDGTFLTVDRDVLADFGEEELMIDGSNFENWHGVDYWNDFAKTMEEAASILCEEGAEMLAYYENDVIVYVDREKMKLRCEFYDFNIFKN